MTTSRLSLAVRKTTFCRRKLLVDVGAPAQARGASLNLAVIRPPLVDPMGKDSANN